MATKTLTITENAYMLLKRNKQSEESFSEEITRFFGTKKRSLMDFAGVWSKEEGEAMLNDLAEIKRKNIERLRRENHR